MVWIDKELSFQWYKIKVYNMTTKKVIVEKSPSDLIYWDFELKTSFYLNRYCLGYSRIVLLSISKRFFRIGTVYSSRDYPEYTQREILPLYILV